LNWILGTLALTAVMTYLAMEAATYKDRGNGLRSYLKTFRTSLLVLVPFLLSVDCFIICFEKEYFL
jgi:hypothetical protein